MKKVLQGLILGIFLIFTVNTIVANELDYQIDFVTLISQTDYQDGSADFKFRIVYEPNTFYSCTYACSWYHSLNPSDKHSFKLYETSSDLTEEGKFTINLKANQRIVTGSFNVKCQREGVLCFDSTITEKTVTFSTNHYGYNGDGDCQEEKESCALSIDCSCSKEGKSSSGKDLKQCMGSGLTASCNTYCGNEVCENSESCFGNGDQKSCQSDCKNCDGFSCNTPADCKGNYCVYGKCSSKPYIEGDSYCDLNVGENCKNSLMDCACDKNKRCGKNAICETYCGNGVCEQEEVGICKTDCQWCGDGICNANENCKMCSLDCGSCKEEKTGILGLFTGGNECNPKTCWGYQNGECVSSTYDCNYIGYEELCFGGFPFETKQECDENSKSGSEGSCYKKCWNFKEGKCKPSTMSCNVNCLDISRYNSEEECEIDMEIKTNKLTQITGFSISEKAVVDKKKSTNFIIITTIVLLLLVIFAYTGRKFYTNTERYKSKKAEKLKNRVKNYEEIIKDIEGLKDK